MPESRSVRGFRSAGRRFVRELGFLQDQFSPAGVTHAQCHALLELESGGVLTAGVLAQRLLLDKSTVSRTLAQFVERGWVTTRPDPDDKRRKPLALTEAGRQKVQQIHEAADGRVEGALSLLTAAQRDTVTEGMALYARALRKARLQEGVLIRPVEPRDNPDVASIIRAVMPEFGADRPGFALHDAEVDAISEAYAGPDSAFFVVERDGRVLGCGGVGPLASAEGSVCELRKMYFMPSLRGLGMGRKLLATCLDAATERGYALCYLETFGPMVQAQRLYESFGFEKLDGPLGSTGHFGCDTWYALKLGTSPA